MWEIIETFSVYPVPVRTIAETSLLFCCHATHIVRETRKNETPFDFQRINGNEKIVGHVPDIQLSFMSVIRAKPATVNGEKKNVLK